VFVCSLLFPLTGTAGPAQSAVSAPRCSHSRSSPSPSLLPTRVLLLFYRSLLLLLPLFSPSSLMCVVCRCLRRRSVEFVLTHTQPPPSRVSVASVHGTSSLAPLFFVHVASSSSSSPSTNPSIVAALASHRSPPPPHGSVSTSYRPLPSQITGYIHSFVR
jgi:hypothetical protein